MWRAAFSACGIDTGLALLKRFSAPFASFTKRSVSSRIDRFDISRFSSLLPPRSTMNPRHFSRTELKNEGAWIRLQHLCRAM